MQKRSRAEADRASGPVLDVRGIASRLPHRFPVLLVDRVLSFDDGKTLTAIKNVTVNEPFFLGHFPERPVMPGVLLASCSTDGVPDDRGVVLAGIERARFRRPVEPGDQLVLEIQLLKKHRPLWKMRGRARVDGQVVAEAEFLTMEVDAAEVRRTDV